jgi:hypothetical protein
MATCRPGEWPNSHQANGKPIKDPKVPGAQGNHPSPKPVATSKTAFSIMISHSPANKPLSVIGLS